MKNETIYLLRIPESLKDKIKKYSKEERRSMNSFILVSIEKRIELKNKVEATKI